MATFLQKENSIAGNADLMKRITWSVGRYAAFILGGGSSDASLISWAKLAIPGTNAERYADLMKRSVVNDPNYINGSAVGDTDAADALLNAIVETAINSTYKAL